MLQFSSFLVYRLRYLDVGEGDVGFDEGDESASLPECSVSTYRSEAPQRGGPAALTQFSFLDRDHIHPLLLHQPLKFVKFRTYSIYVYL